MTRPGTRATWVAFLACVALLAGAAHAEDCHPQVDPSKSQYIVGYGSLMESPSKQMSEPNTGMNLPVHLLQYGCEAKDVVNMAAIAVVDAQEADGVELPPMAELEEPEPMLVD